MTFENRCRFAVSLRYELFYSLTHLLDPASRIHPEWRAASLKRLPASFTKKLERLGGSPEIWSVLPALLPKDRSEPTFEEIHSSFEALPSRELQERILKGILHSEAVVDALLRGREPLPKALGRSSREKREWLAHLGLYPFRSDAPLAFALELLVEKPAEFRSVLLDLLDLYWKHVFAATWRELQPALARSVEEKRRLFASCTFEEFAQQALLRVEVSGPKRSIRAIRGGYSIAQERVGSCFLLPSAFNDRRYWSALEDGPGEAVIYFPYFDPSIGVSGAVPAKTAKEPELDPALIFRALGDSTRFALASLLAREPTTAVELARALDVSKPTISHHVHQLREAGLLREEFQGGSVRLTLRREVLEALSTLTIQRLYRR